ncbi:PREDICTED: uncharacterized protein LOC105108592 isoform X4 [Populus euphratica]|uniref:Uncharacterized protein LOC105108592 isoform X4 n=1 Tax=Populus euphratica TaxID=75702 RepID=A0AAJ6SYD4_POPEU|nr:PREDICTED: uncharacterized protein LOC105108592 isoform X4 [Populus euphratica]
MYFQSECSDFRDGNMEWLHLRMVLFMEEETLGLGKGKDHSKVYWTNGKNIAGCYLGLDWEIKQQRNCFLNLAAGRTRMPLNLAEMITVGTHVCKVDSCLCFINLPRTNEVFGNNFMLI